MKTENRYIKIEEYLHTGRTKGFNVTNKSGGYIIGEIYWYTNWRQYCFYLLDNMVFNSECLELITDFLKEINIEHKKNWVQKKESA